jgi:hypothetical protein
MCRTAFQGARVDDRHPDCTVACTELLSLRRMALNGGRKSMQTFDEMKINFALITTNRALRNQVARPVTCSP